MFSAIPHVPTVASFQSFVPHSFNSATFGTARKSSSFTSLHEPTHRHSAICLQSFSNGFVLQSKNTNPTNAHAGSYCFIPFQQSFRSVQSLPLPLPTLMQKITPALPSTVGVCRPHSSGFCSHHPCSARKRLASTATGLHSVSLHSDLPLCQR